MPPWEEGIFRAINDFTHRFERGLWPLQQLGKALMIPVGALILWWLCRSWRPPLTLLIVSTLLGWGAANVIREIVGRDRPGSLLDDVRLGYDVPLSGVAFPSGHAIVVFTLIVVLAPYVTPRTVAAMAGLAIAVMVVRVYVGAHMPLDVVGGAGFGIVVGSVVNLIAGTNDRRGVELRPQHG